MPSSNEIYGVGVALHRVEGDVDSVLRIASILIIVTQPVGDGEELREAAEQPSFGLVKWRLSPRRPWGSSAPGNSI
jgi:hypothetical protein